MQRKLGSQKNRNEIINLNVTTGALPKIYHKFMNDSPKAKHDAVFVDEGETNPLESYHQHFKQTMKHGFTVN